MSAPAETPYQYARNEIYDILLTFTTFRTDASPQEVDSIVEQLMSLLAYAQMEGVEAAQELAAGRATEITNYYTPDGTNPS